MSYNRDNINTISTAQVRERGKISPNPKGNADPAGQFCRGTVESIREETLRIMGECWGHSNFVISSSCDIPPASPWENIDAFFGAVKEYYCGRNDKTIK